MKKFLLASLSSLLIVWGFFGCKEKLSPPSETQQSSNEFAYASEFVNQLNQAGVKVRSVKSSIYASFFPATLLKGAPKAAWIETDLGVVEAVFFTGENEADEIQVNRLPENVSGRSRYQVNMKNWNRTIDSNRPLHFNRTHNLFTVTDSQGLDDKVKQVFPF